MNNIKRNQELAKCLGIPSLMESETVEFKTNYNGVFFSRLLSAFANTSGGVIIYGLQEPDIIIGLTQMEIDSAQKSILQIADDLGVQVYLTILNIESKQLIRVFVERLKEKKVVINTDGKAYVRIGESIKPMDIVTDQAIKDIEKQNKYHKRFKCFIAMSFHFDEYPQLEDYYNAICRGVKESKLPLDKNIVRVDLINGDFAIDTELLQQIETSDIIIADFTLNSPNVYYEAGYARGKGKKVIQIAENKTSIPFDINHNKTYFYKNATQLEKDIILPLTTICKELLGMEKV